MYSLFIDTHNNTNLAIFKNKKLIKQVNSFEIKQSTIIMPLLNNLLNELNLDLKNIKEIIVVNGPGSFTGVRLGVTIAKTIAYSLSIPIKCINSLAILAISDSFKNDIYAFKDTKGAYIGICADSRIKLEYITNNELNNIDVKTDVIYDITNIYDYEYLLEEKSAHLINPIYIKKIEAQK